MERVSIPRGLTFPGVIALPTEGRMAEQKEERNRASIAKWSEDPWALWTDGSALPLGVCAAAVVGYVRQQAGHDGSQERQTINRRATCFQDRNQ